VLQRLQAGSRPIGSSLGSQTATTPTKAPLAERWAASAPPGFTPEKTANPAHWQNKQPVAYSADDIQRILMGPPGLDVPQVPQNASGKAVTNPGAIPAPQVNPPAPPVSAAEQPMPVPASQAPSMQHQMMWGSHPQATPQAVAHSAAQPSQTGMWGSAAGSQPHPQPMLQSGHPQPHHQHYAMPPSGPQQGQWPGQHPQQAPPSMQFAHGGQPSWPAGAYAQAAPRAAYNGYMGPSAQQWHQQAPQPAYPTQAQQQHAAHMAHLAQQHAAMQYVQAGGGAQQPQGYAAYQQQMYMQQQQQQQHAQAQPPQGYPMPPQQQQAAYEQAPQHAYSQGMPAQPYPGAFGAGEQQAPQVHMAAPSGSPAKSRAAASRSVLTAHPAVDASECVAAYEEEGHLDLSVAHGLCAAESNVLLHITAEEPMSGVDSVALYRLAHAVSALAHGRVGGNESSPDALEAAARRYVVLKSLSTHVRAPPRNGGAYSRFLKFRAPRGHGVYVFRYFDGEEFDKSVPPSSLDDLDAQFGMTEGVPQAIGHSTIMRVLVQGDALASALSFCQSQLQDAYNAHSDMLVLMQQHSMWAADQAQFLDLSNVSAALGMADTFADAGGEDIDFEPSTLLNEHRDIEDMNVRCVCGITIPMLPRKMGLSAGGAIASLHALLHQTVVPPASGSPVWSALRLVARLVALQRVLYSSIMDLERLVLEGLAAEKAHFDADAAGDDLAASRLLEETAFGAALGVLDGMDDDGAAEVEQGGGAELKGASVPLSALFEPSLWLQRDALACSASLVAAMDDVIGNASLFGCLAVPQRQRLLQLRAQVCPFTDTLLMLPREVSPPMLSSAKDPSPPSDGQALCHPADGFSAAKQWRPRVRQAVVAAVKNAHQSTAVAGGEPVAALSDDVVVECLIPPAQIPDSVVAAVDALVLSVAPALFPGPDFVAKRNDVVQLVQSITEKLSRVSSGEYSAHCSVFGSSANGFGSPASDVDLALEVARSSGDALDAWSVADLLGELEGLLQEAGMLDLSTRATARVPLLKFSDPVTGLEVDIGLNNVLAQRNTALLRAYASLDAVNVRCLGYMVKSWAKARDLNDPVTGTLSSYAWLLCLLSFLQRRSAKPAAVRSISAANSGPTMLPCLQSLPPAGAVADAAAWNWEDWTRWGGSISTARDVPPATHGQRPSAFVVYTGAPGSSHTGFVEHNGAGHAGSAGTALGTAPNSAGAWDNWRGYVRNPDGVACDTYFAEESSAAFQAAAKAQQPLSQHTGAARGPSCGRLLLEFFWHFAFQADTRRAVVTARPTPPSKVAESVPRAVEQLLAAQAAHDNIVQTVKRARKDSGRGSRRSAGIPAPPQLPMEIAAAAFRFGVKNPVADGASPLQTAIAGSTACEPLKSWKGSMEGWSNKPTLAVEDPMETAYNVAHVLKPSQHHRMRAEMARAYVMLLAAAQGKVAGNAGIQLAPETSEIIAGINSHAMPVHTAASQALGLRSEEPVPDIAPATVAAAGQVLFAQRQPRDFGSAPSPTKRSAAVSIAATVLAVLPGAGQEDWAMPPPHEDVHVLQDYVDHGHVMNLVLPSGAQTVWESSDAVQGSHSPAGGAAASVSTASGQSQSKRSRGGRNRAKGKSKAGKPTLPTAASAPAPAPASGSASGKGKKGGKPADSRKLAAAPAAQAGAAAGSADKSPSASSKTAKRSKKAKTQSASAVASASVAAVAGMLPPSMSQSHRNRSKKASKPKTSE